MKTRSIDEQISGLRPAVAAGFAARLHYWLIAGAGLGVALSVTLWNPVFLIIAFFLGIVGLSERHTGFNITTALAAYDIDESSSGGVSIEITRWSDSYSYHATVRENGHADWTYEFIPQGWNPTAGSHPARIWRNAETKNPVLVTIEGGVLIPRYNPKRVLPDSV